MRKKKDRVVSLVAALRGLEEAAFDSGVSVPISGEHCEQFIRENVRMAAEDAALGDTGEWWSILVNDAQSTGMYVTLLVDEHAVHLRAGKGRGAALMRFADRYADGAYATAMKRLEVQFGRPFWTATVGLDELQ